MKELFLGTLFLREELDIVNQQCVEGAIRGLELIDRVVLQGAHHVADKLLRVHISHPGSRPIGQNEVPDTLHQVGLAEPNTAVDEQGVVAPAWIAAHLQGGGPRHLVALALDELFEGVLRIELAANSRGRPRLCIDWRRLALQVRQASDFQPDGHARNFAQKIRDATEAVGIDPVHHEAIRGKQPQYLGFFHRLQRADPGIELLFGKVGPQLLNAATPEGRWHGFTPESDYACGKGRKAV